MTSTTADYVRRRIGIAAAAACFLLGVNAFLSEIVVLGTPTPDAFLNIAVWLTFVVGAVTLASTVVELRFGSIVQVLVLISVGYFSATSSIGGELTSLIFVGLGLLLASEYGFLKKYVGLKLGVTVVPYLALYSYGLVSNTSGTAFATIHTILGAIAVAYLFVVVAMARLREMQNRQAELARLVAERTSLLQDEVDRRTVAEASMKEIAEHNKALAGDREVLLRELHHRTKNDLQTILSLLSLATGKMERPEFTEFLRPTRDRIRAIALVHEQLDGSERFDTIPVGTYLRRLARHVQASHQDYDVSIQADADAETAVNLESATHLGLLVHELLLCSYTHSFEPGASGTIRLSARVADGTLQVTVSDTGKVLPSTLDPSAPDEDEIAIVEGLVKRLQTTLTLQREPHTCWRAEIPLDVVCRRYTPAVEGAR